MTPANPLVKPVVVAQGAEWHLVWIRPVALSLTQTGLVVPALAWVRRLLEWLAGGGLSGTKMTLTV